MGSGVKRTAVMAEDVAGTGGWLVTLMCGHKIATRKQAVSYECRECAPAPPLDRPEDLDPDIRHTVMWLRSLGFDTTDSGDGRSKAELIASGDALDFPHVFMACPPAELHAEADRLHAELRKRLWSKVALCEPIAIEANYAPIDGSGVLVLRGVDDALMGLGDG